MYGDGYFARKVIGVGRLVTTWRWADKLQRATDEELRWAPNKIARLLARVRQQEADRYVKRYEAEDSEYCLRAGKTPAHQGDAGKGLPEYCPQEGLLVLVLFVFNFMHCT